MFSSALDRTPAFRQLSFDDNQKLLMLVGGHDAHLTLLEESFGVSVIHRGSKITVTGDNSPQVDRVADLLDQHYQNLQPNTPPEAFEDLIQRFAPIQSSSVSVPKPAASIQKPTAQGSLLIPDIPPPPQPQPFAQDRAGFYVATPKGNFTARNANQERYLRSIREATMVFGFGAAGTGKTFLAVAMAVSMLCRGEIERIVLTRPAREAGEQLGFLPGDINEKLDPYLRPIHDALEEMLPRQSLEHFLQTRQIEIAPLAYMRGRTLKNALIILDEAQNTTRAQMLMFLTRIGEGSKMIINGDPKQIDLPSGQVSGLVQAAKNLTPDQDIRLVHFLDSDIVRHPLIGRIVRAFDAQ